MKIILRNSLTMFIFSLQASHGALTTGLVTYLDFNDLENAPEASGPNATAVGGAAVGISGGRVGNSAEFSGTTGDYIRIPVSFGSGVTNLGQNFTVGAWYRLNNPPNSATGRFFVYESSNDFGLSYGLRNFDANDGLVDGQTFTQPTMNALYANVHVSGSWQHVMHTYSFNAGTTTIETFIDGVSRGNLQTSATLADTSINIGNARNSELDRTFDGKIDEFVAWNRILSLNEISQVYNLGLNGQVIPEPSSHLLIGLVVGLGVFVRRRS